VRSSDEQLAIVDPRRLQAHVDAEMAYVSKHGTRLAVILMRLRANATTTMALAAAARVEQAGQLLRLVGSDGVLFCLENAFVVVVRNLEDVATRMLAERLTESVIRHPLYCGAERLHAPSVDVVSHPARELGALGELLDRG
jgi:mRNA-degrading endonuclease toxin of MazEF toxin-antitoxin module